MIGDQLAGMIMLVGDRACLPVLAAAVFLGRVYVADDLGEFHLPLRDFYSRQLAARRGVRLDAEPVRRLLRLGRRAVGSLPPLALALYRLLPHGGGV